MRRLVTVRAGLRKERHQSADVIVRVHQLILVSGRQMKPGQPRHGQDVLPAHLLSSMSAWPPQTAPQCKLPIVQDDVSGCQCKANAQGKFRKASGLAEGLHLREPVLDCGVIG